MFEPVFIQVGDFLTINLAAVAYTEEYAARLGVEKPEQTTKVVFVGDAPPLYLKDGERLEFFEKLVLAAERGQMRRAGKRFTEAQ